jgi:beta-lactamase regulating signal transducer with metallopeptidase domain
VIFTARGIMVSLAFFAVVYTFLSVALIAAWSGFVSLKRVSSPSARVLFGLRILPFAASASITLFLTFPSFLLLEAHTMDEDLGTFVLCLCAVVFVVSGSYRVMRAEQRTRRALSQWLEASRVEGGSASGHVLPIMLAGIRAPKLMVSDRARHLLTEGELRVAIRHEMQHLGSGDNLKKAILNFVFFPGMASLDRAWQKAAEFDADRGAVCNRGEALDLASALVKLSRSTTLPIAPVFVTGLIGVADSVAVRVQRLLDWKTVDPVMPLRWRYIIPAAGAVILCLAAHIGSALLLAHSMTERLVP